MVRYEVDGDVAVLTVDNPPVNALNHAIRAGLYEAVSRADADPQVRAAVILCAGSTFIVGADLRELGQPRRTPNLRTVQEALELAIKPFVAAMHGTALGGGLELALACHWRVAMPGTRFGLPEVNIGLIPGGGGTQRLPRLIGAQPAMDMILSGKPVDADRALATGLIDAVLEGDDLRAAAVGFARSLVSAAIPPPVSQRDDRVRNVDRTLFQEARRKLEKKARGQFAPWQAINAVEAACTVPFTDGDAIEQACFRKCLDSPQRSALTHLFRSERLARHIPGVDGVAPLPIDKAAVIGAGTMGGGIAMSFANAGIPVRLIDISAQALAQGLERIEHNFAISVERGSASPQQVARSRALITSSTAWDVSDVDIVVEAVVENMAIKREIFARLDAAAPPRALLASNTSSLDIDEIAGATARPDKVIGTHFFSPANVMKLMENVRGRDTSPQTIASVIALGRRLGKVPVLAGNCDGFIGNRMFQFWMNGWEYLLEEGATPEQIDRVVTDFGMAMGPLQVRDLAGLDVAVMVRAARAPSLPPQERVSCITERVAALGRYGQKTGAGFYRYEGRTPVPDPAVIEIIEAAAAEAGITRRIVRDEEIVPRMIAPMVNEGARVLADGIALRASDIDVIYCHGYGFPKHLGGPMYWSEHFGLHKILQIMEDLGKRFGPRYAPAPLLVALARSGEGWPQQQPLHRSDA